MNIENANNFVEHQTKREKILALCAGDCKITFGRTQCSCIYDAAVMLSMMLDTIVIDRESEFYMGLKALLDAAWDELPSIVMIELYPD